MLKSTRLSKKKLFQFFFLSILRMNFLLTSSLVVSFIQQPWTGLALSVIINFWCLNVWFFPFEHIFLFNYSVFFCWDFFFRSSVFPLVTSRYSLEIALADNVFIESILISIYLVKSIHVICYARPKKRSNNKGASMCVTATMEQLVISEFVY